MLHRKDDSRLKEVWFCAKEDKPVTRAEIVKGYEYSKGKYATVEDSELKKIAPPTATAMQILQFVAADEVDPIRLEKSYYVAPEEQGARPYALLRKAMMETKLNGVAKVAMHGREHIVLIRPDESGLVLHTLYFENELSKSNRAGKGTNAKFGTKELELAKKLIDTLQSRFLPEQYEDEYRQNVEHLIAEKRKGKKVTEHEQPKVTPVVGIMDALRRSLDRKPSAHAKRKSAGKRARKAA